MKAETLDVNRRATCVAVNPRAMRPSLTLICGAALVTLFACGCDRIVPHKTASNETARPTPAAKPPPLPPPAPAAIAAPARMTPAEQASFDAWMIKTYLACWRQTPEPRDADPYVAQVRLAFNPDGSLSKPAKLVNPPSNPALKSQAKSVMAAVQACNPLPVPAQYRPFYQQWKTKTLHFDPQVAAR